MTAGALPPGQLLGADKEWTTFDNCQLVPNAANDGDSFHIRSNGTEYLVRLYFVDAPETKGGEMAGRLIEQATYFHVSVPEVIEIGRQAKEFVEQKLSQPFSVQTKKASGLGRSNIERFYGFVQTKDGDLGQLLVANGLARVHGTKVARPGAKNSNEELEQLQQAENRARDAKLGAWRQGVAAGNNSPAPSASLPTSNPAATVTTTVAAPASTAIPAMPRTTPVTAAHAAAVAATQSTPIPPLPRTAPVTPPPAQIVTSRTPAAALPPAVASTTAKLDVNTASKEQLEKIPGVGPALSERIIAARPFRSADDLKSVKGIGEGKRYEQIRAFFQ